MRLQNIIDSIGPAIDRKIDALIADCEAPQIEIKKGLHEDPIINFLREQGFDGIRRAAAGRSQQQAAMANIGMRGGIGGAQTKGLLSDGDYYDWIAKKHAGQSLSKSIFGFDLIGRG